MFALRWPVLWPGPPQGAACDIGAFERIPIEVIPATLVDGVLDIQVINATKTRAPAIVPKVIRGTHLRDPAVRRFSAAEFKIETDPTWPLEADGDLIGNTTVTGRVVPAAIRLKI